MAGDVTVGISRGESWGKAAFGVGSERGVEGNVFVMGVIGGGVFHVGVFGQLRLG